MSFQEIIREDTEELFPNLDKFCEMISLYTYDGKPGESNSHAHLLECFSDMDRMDIGTMDPLSERNNMFWQPIRTKDHVNEDAFFWKRVKRCPCAT